MSRAIFFLHAFIFTNFLPLKALETDIKCLKSIKNSLEDPFRSLSSWDFDYIDKSGSICKFNGVECSNIYASKIARLELSGMGLKGKFPRGIKDCRSLESLNLSHNELHGSIPRDIGLVMPSITSLDLSSNKFSGEIPPSLASCSYLEVLKLENNCLTGRIPKEFRANSRIRVTEEWLEDNPRLCKRHISSEDPFRKGVAIGYSMFFIATIVAFSRCGLPSWMSFKMLKKRRKMKKKYEVFHTKLPASDSRQRREKELAGLEKMLARFPYNDMRNATNNFQERNMIGMGNTGIVFKAILPGGKYLAVKKLHYHQFLDEHFVLELKTLGTLKHTNLLPLLGFCVKSKERLLVYKYMPNGRLYDWLNPVKEKSKSMDWAIRVKIAVGLARGLAWLHKGEHIRVIHLNVSSKCIILDQDFEPRLSNFEEAMLITPSSKNSCLNPEFWEMGFIMEDVFSFGVVLLELITGEDSSRYYSQHEWISCLSERNSSTFYDLIDKSIVEQEIGDEMYRFIEIAFGCVQSVPERRPTMQQVYREIAIFGEKNRLFDVSNGRNETSILDHKGKYVDIEIDET